MPGSFCHRCTLDTVQYWKSEMECSSVSVLSRTITLARRTVWKWSWFKVNVYSLDFNERRKIHFKKIKTEKILFFFFMPKCLTDIEDSVVLEVIGIYEGFSAKLL